MRFKTSSLFLCAVLIGLAGIFVPAHAQPISQDVPLFSLTRTQLGAGLNYEWWTADREDATEPPFEKEFSVGVYGAHNIIPELDAIGFIKYGLENRFGDTALGLRYTFMSEPLWQIGAGMNYEWLWGEGFQPPFDKQFTVGLYGQRTILPKLYGIAFGKYGLDSRDYNFALGARMPFFNGGRR